MDRRKQIIILSAVCGLLTFALLFIFMKKVDQPKQTAVESPSAVAVTSQMLIRLAMIEVYPEYLQEYLDAASTVGGESVEKEPGVVCIFPMQMKRESNQIRIIEIYRDEAAYQSHLQTEHFLKYKNGTLHMVKSLDLQEMRSLHPDAMPFIFRKFYEE